MTTIPPNPDDPRWSGPILTVGDLRRIIEGMDDYTNVVVDSIDGWYLNIGVVYAPPLDDDDDDLYSEWQCLTLLAGSEFNARQI